MLNIVQHFAAQRREPTLENDSIHVTVQEGEKNDVISNDECTGGREF